MAHLSLDEVLAWLSAEVTGLTTAFAQATILTGLSIERSLIILIHRIEWFVPAVHGGDGNVAAQITRTSQTAILTVNNPLVVAPYINHMDFTTSGQIFKEMPKGEIYVVPIPIASPALYFGVTPSATPTPDSARVRIGYTVKSVAEKDFFKLAAAITL